MLQSGNGCDELNVVTGNRVTQEACANAVSTVAKPQERTTDFPAVAPRTHQKLSEFGIMPTVKYWEVIADKLSGAGWSWSYCSAMTQHGWRWVVDVRRNDGHRHNTANPHYSSKHRTPKIER